MQVKRLTEYFKFPGLQIQNFKVEEAKAETLGNWDIDLEV